MHFGLYAFDLFETIYEESWDKGSCPALQEAYASKEDFIRDVPRLIIEHNIHGIDIDPRATQIAALSLWLRAQKAWQQQKVPAADRPRVRRSNIVCAEPMPGSPEMLKDFVATLNPPLIGELVKNVFDKMQLAGEAGSLLKIEEEIRTAIDTARKEWLKQQDDLLTRKDGSQEEFFATAEQQVIDALRAYAEQADADSYQRRLFADDAARGFAFIDLCRKRYDAVVMNPPYGDLADSTLGYAKECYPTFSNNIYSCFWRRTVELCHLGFVGALTSRTFLTLSQFEGVRGLLLSKERCLKNVIDLGPGILDGAAVDTAATTVACGKDSDSGEITFLRLDDLDEEREEVVRSAIDNSEKAHFDRVYIGRAKAFLALPQKRIFYAASPRVLRLFSASDSLDPCLADVRPGLLTGHDFRFLRFWWEITKPQTDWHPLAKGGDYERFHGELPFRLNWQRNGVEVREYALATVGSVSKWIFNEQYYFRPGITFPNSGMGFSARILPGNSIISVKGQGIFTNHASSKLTLLGLLNTSLVHALLYLFNPGKDVQAGDVKGLPFASLPNESDSIEKCVLRILSQQKRLHSFDETSNCFVLPFRLFGVSTGEFSRVADEITNLENEILAETCRHYRIDSKEVSSLCAHTKDRPSVTAQLTHSMSHLLGPRQEAAILVSWAFGVLLGRWDIRYATDERQPPELPDPFDPLPVCPPGMLQNAEGLPAEPKDVPADYPLRISWPGILVDDENHPEDIVARVREAIEVIWPGSAGSGSRAEAIEQEACEILGVKTLRDYFRRPAAFFADHLKRYSKSRRQAPIYWPLSTKSGSYTLWLYYHRLTDQTLHTCLADFLDPKLRKVQSELGALTNSGGGGTRAGELREFLDELKDLHDEIERVIKLPWKPNLNDGVIITASPLHKLFRLPKWQKDLKTCWDELAKGEYDWAHLAHTIWPQRVEKACAKDRSIAIAHDLEHLCKIETPKPKKKRGKNTEEEEPEEEEPEEDASEQIEED
jgi:hypothetical protein